MTEAIVLYFLSPLTLALLGLIASGACAFAHNPRAARGLAWSSAAVLWIGSSPWVAETLLQHLEGQYTAIAPEAAERADAILVLGGAVIGAHPPGRPTLLLVEPSARAWYAAALYHAGKAPHIVVAAGNRSVREGVQVEADAIKELLIALGVPAPAIVLESASRTTRENAAYVLPLLQAMHAKRVLLVTSARHMPRALQTFVKMWGEMSPELIPVVTDSQSDRIDWLSPKVWLPSPDALISVNSSLKELAGSAAVAIIP